jgi:uncharacterized membrane protein YccC
VVLWILLPIAILIAGIAPAAISFAAGQAAFTVVLVVLFNIGQDPNWHIVLFRIQDIGIGCGVSLLVALFFWPRGAAAAVDKALAEAYTDSAAYLAGAVRYALSRCGEGDMGAGPPAQESRQAAAAARRLDDAFRSFLAERGAKPMPLADMTTLVTGVVGLRLAADAVLALWRQAGQERLDADGADARLELLGAAEGVTAWYRELAVGLDRRSPVPEPVARNPVAVARLVDGQRGAHHLDRRPRRRGPPTAAQPRRRGGDRRKALIAQGSDGTGYCWRRVLMARIFSQGLRCGASRRRARARGQLGSGK